MYQTRAVKRDFKILGMNQSLVQKNISSNRHVILRNKHFNIQPLISKFPLTIDIHGIIKKRKR